MVQTRSASGFDVPATPGGRPTSSGKDTARRAPASARSRRSMTPALDGDSKPTTVARRKKASIASASAWTYVPDSVTLIWMAVSLPLVAWDTGYVLLRPLTMPGGSLHWPLYTPYALYGEVDHIYGFKQWNARNGFTAAQGALNFVETSLYLAFLYLWQAYGRSVQGAGFTASSSRKGLVGRVAAWAALLAFSSAVMTLSKTVLYWLNEYFSGFDNIGHNDLYSLVFLWIIPKIGGEVIDVLASTAVVVVKEE
ncbi:hypothetical protein F503_05903 [Ophiostoma piceae UAMH 11346]|uniref:C6 transcription factor n=1 Tax=Ophiostoma piceae (strain UAMH 11346) TaxID=1262450 RepID=S3CVT0_OPHP1|nr:hypothetical protein F503_05903 [Ophiostoma piceae UAMH 11346]